MIEHAYLLLAKETFPSWEKDAALRREFERLKEDVKGYEVAAISDERRARRKAALVNERAERITQFLNNRRFGGLPGGGQSLNSRFRYE